MLNVMAALPNIGGALCSTPQCLAVAHYYSPCSNAAKTQNPLKFAGLPQTRQQTSSVNRSKFAILAEHVEEVLLFNRFFFPIVDTCLRSEDIAQQSCAMVPKWRFFESCISSELRAAHFRPEF